jgi:ABC-type phosphate transport system permease subunit
MWGLFVFAPLFQTHVQPLISKTLGSVPCSARLSGPPMGIGMLTAGIILAVMVIPFITAVMRDVFELVPPMLKESAYGLGSTTWEVVWRVVLPYTKVGVIGGIMLGLGRALGETMAVTFVIGNAHRSRASLYAPGNSHRLGARQRVHRSGGRPLHSALIELGLILFLITTIVLALSKLLLMQLARQEGAARERRQRRDNPAIALPRAAHERRDDGGLHAARSPSACSGCCGSSACCCARARRAAARALHADDAAARRRRRPRQRDRRQRPHGGRGTLIGTPIGILAGTYLAEYGRAAGSRRRRASSTTCCSRRPRS